MQVNAYEYDDNDRLVCMARHVDPRALMGDDRDELARVLRELRKGGSATIGGGAAPLILIRRVANIPTDAEKPRGHYGPMCRDPRICAGKGYCPRDPSCVD